MPCRRKNRHIELTATRTSRSANRSRISSSVRSARSPTSANRKSCCTASGERLRPFCGLASELPVRRHRPTQAVAVDSPTPSRRAAPRADAPPCTARITRMRKSLEYALGMPSPNSIYGCILAPPRDMDNHLNLKFRLYAAGKCFLAWVMRAEGAIAIDAMPYSVYTDTQRRESNTMTDEIVPWLAKQGDARRGDFARWRSPRG